MSDRALFIAGAGAVVVLGVVGYLAARKLGLSIANNAQLVNPLSRENIVYRGANAVGAALTGNPSYNLGSSAFELIHSEPDLTAAVNVQPAVSMHDLLTRSYYLTWTAQQERELADRNRAAAPAGTAPEDVWIVG